MAKKAVPQKREVRRTIGLTSREDRRFLKAAKAEGVNVKSARAIGDFARKRLIGG